LEASRGIWATKTEEQMVKEYNSLDNVQVIENTEDLTNYVFGNKVKA